MPWSAFHEIDVLNRNRAAVAEIGNEDRETNGGLRGRNRQHQERKNLADEIAEIGRKRHEVDIDRQQYQFDRHQNDDDVFAVEEYSEYPERKQDGANRQVMSQPDCHDRPCPDLTLTTSIALDLVRATCLPASWRRAF